MTKISVEQDDRSVTISDSEFTMVMGPSGSGKSTLLYMIEAQGPQVSFDPPDPDISTIYHDIPRGGGSVYIQHKLYFDRVIRTDPDILLIDEIDSGPHEERPEIQKALRHLRDSYDGTTVCVSMDQEMKDFGDRLIELERVK